jgi:uncharacterized repeat protein (TIGR01451 family)
VTQADLDTGERTNLVTATSTQSAPATDTVRVTFQQDFALTIEKSVSDDASLVTAAGQTVTYSYLVTNTGNTTLTNVTAVDDNGTPADTSDDVTLTACQTPSLAPGATTECSYVYTVSQADLDRGSLTNIATADADRVDPVTDTVTLTFAQTPAITVVKTADVDGPETTVDAVGDTVTYSYLVTNTGNVTLTLVGVQDDRITGTNTVSCPVATLAPGAFTTCTATYTVTQADLDAGSVTNLATASGTPPTGSAVTATDTATVQATQRPLLV